MPSKNYSKSPLPLFDSIDHIKKSMPPAGLNMQEIQDFNVARAFLEHYTGSQGTFNSYRREIERFLHWTWLVEKKTIPLLRRDDIENFIRFCQKPPAAWIGLQKVARFLEKEAIRLPNPAWRPFVVSLSKAAYRAGERPIHNTFTFSPSSIKELLAILSTFYNYLLQEEYVSSNPVSLMRQKSKFIRSYQGQTRIRRLSTLQWQYLLATTQKLADEDPKQHERSLFMLSALYSLYLRISELAASSRWQPLMNHFQRDREGHWWFVTVGKGNKERQIAVSEEMLAALKRWRKHLGLAPLPSAADDSPLLPKRKGAGSMTNTSHLRKIMQICFDQTARALNQDGFTEEASALIAATVHWLRHTGISDDVKRRPREHVRDDAGHSSSATTDKYIDIELWERHRSARNKPMK